MKSAKRLNFLAVSQQEGWGKSLQRSLSNCSYSVRITRMDAFIPIQRYLLRSLPHAILLDADLNASVIIQVGEAADRISPGLPVCLIGESQPDGASLNCVAPPDQMDADLWVSQIMNSGANGDSGPLKMRIMQQLNQSIEALEALDAHHRGGSPGGYANEIRTALLASRRKLENLQDRMRKG